MNTQIRWGHLLHAGILQRAKEPLLPYFLAYSMLIGSSRRVVETAAEATLAYQQIRRAGGTVSVVTDHTGRVFTFEDLRASITSSVLVVEDDPLVRFMACALVEDAGFAAVEANDADEAIAILEVREDIRLVFTDVNMPGTMDGLKLAHYVRDRWPPIQILLVSGKSFIKSPDLPVGARFMPRPYGTADVISTLRRMLR